MSTWLTLDQVNCEAVGLHVLAFPPVKVIPRRRAHKASAPGGMTLWTYEGTYGYEDMMLPITFYYDGKADADLAAAFLMPDTRDIVFGDQPEFCYRGRVDEQTEIEKIFRERRPCRFKVNFICRPVRALTSPGAPLIFSQAGEIDHQGTARSYPKITVEGEGEGEITIGGRAFQVYNLVSGAPLIIDSPAMICTDQAGEADRSGDTAGDYPYLDPGINQISFTGGIARLQIEPNFWWLGR